MESFIAVKERYIKLIKICNLNYGEILLLSKIESLSQNEKKACTASNDYFSDVLCTSKRNIQKYLERLKENQLIKPFEQKSGMKTTTRFLYVQYEHINMLLKETGVSKEHTEKNDKNTSLREPKKQKMSVSIEDISLETKQKVIELYNSGYKYNKKNKQIQAETGCTGEQIFQIIKEWESNGRKWEDNSAKAFEYEDTYESSIVAQFYL